MYKLITSTRLPLSNLPDTLEKKRKPSKEGKSHELTVGLNWEHSTCESNTLTRYLNPLKTTIPQFSFFNKIFAKF